LKEKYKELEIDFEDCKGDLDHFRTTIKDLKLSLSIAEHKISECLRSIETLSKERDAAIHERNVHRDASSNLQAALEAIQTTKATDEAYRESVTQRKIQAAKDEAIKAKAESLKATDRVAELESILEGKNSAIHELQAEGNLNFSRMLIRCLHSN
jgi:chromosome segregation ATPase